MRCQFRLRTAIWFILIASLTLAAGRWKIVTVERRRAAVEQITRYGGAVRYEFEYDAAGNLNPNPPRHGPDWFVGLVGEDFFATPTRLYLEGSAFGDSALAELMGRVDSLSRVEFLSVAGSKVTDCGLRGALTLQALRYLDLEGTRVSGSAFLHGHLAKNLREVYFSNTDLDDAGLGLVSSCRRIRRLDLDGTRITDHGLIYLKELPWLEDLSLDNLPITDEGMKTVRLIKSLESLSLVGTRVTNSGAQYLTALRKRRYLNLHETNVTKKVKDELCTSLPYCEIH